MAPVDVRRVYPTLQHEEEYSSNCRQKDYQAGDEHMCGLLQYSLCGTRDAAQNWEEELASKLRDLKLTRVVACPCVWQGCIKDKHIVATVHGDHTTIGGERSAVEFLVKMRSTKIPCSRKS